MDLKNKTVLIISQQEWGTMFISKHHYALELAKAGNTVFYMAGPDQEKRIWPGAIEIEQTSYKDVYNIKHRLPFPYVLKFKVRWLYDYLLSSHLKKVLKKTRRKIDIVWSFDLSDTIPLRMFPGDMRKIYMPVDELTQEAGIRAAESAEVIVSVTNEILDKFSGLKTPRLFLNHGVADVFVNDDITESANKPLQVGLSGNFLRTDVDWETIFKIISKHPLVMFNFYGSFDYKSSNLTSVGDGSTLKYIEQLKNTPNAKMHGQVPYTELAKALKKMDCFLICYDVVKDQSKGTNYHKILEYLATGKTVVSNNVSTYQQHPGLLEMAVSRENNNELPVIFDTVVNHITEYNKAANQQKRIDFAKQYTYSNQLLKIASYLN